MVRWLGLAPWRFCLLLGLTLVWAAPAVHAQEFTLKLEDQYGQPVVYPPPTGENQKPPAVVLLVSDKEGADAAQAWGQALASRFEKALATDPPALAIVGVAHLKGVPAMMRGMVKGFFIAPPEQPAKPAVGLDWEGVVAEKLGFVPGQANLYLFDSAGALKAKFSGPANPQNQKTFWAKVSALGF